MCGSKRAHIEWDAEARTWFCVLRTDTPAPRKRVKPEPPPGPPEAPLPALRCDRCGAVLLEGATDGVSAHCARCKRWVVQGGAG